MAVSGSLSPTAESSLKAVPIVGEREQGVPPIGSDLSRVNVSDFPPVASLRITPSKRGKAVVPRRTTQTKSF